MILSFGDCEIDTDRRELTRAGELVSVEPKVFDFLVLLASHHDRVVGRDELIEKLWNGRLVSDAALSTCVKAARQAVGDDGTGQAVIRTVQKVGFRLVSAVSMRHTPDPGSFDAARGSAAPSAEPLPRGLDDARQPLRLPDQPSIAVLPFEALTLGDRAISLGTGLVRDITTRLGRVRWLFVIARGSASHFRPNEVREISTVLAVRYVVQGSVLASGRRARINVALVDTIQQKEIWSDLFDRSLDDFPVLPEEITEAIVGRIQAEIEQIERERAVLMPFASLDAWTAYHRGGWHLDRHTPSDYDQAEACFLRAAELDPRSARATAGLSAVHRQRAFLGLTGERDRDAARALELAQQSLALDARDPQAHWAMGRALMLRFEVDAALEAFETASALNPSFAMSQYSLGFAQAMVGMVAPSDVALAKSRRLSPIDPMRFAMFAAHSFNALGAGDHERAAELARIAAAQPNAHYHIVAIAALCSALARREADADRYAVQLRMLQPAYSAADFFQAFPFQRREQLAVWECGFRLLGQSA